MERPDKTIGAGKEDFIIFDENDQQFFPADKQPVVVLSVEAALHKAYQVVKAARTEHKEGSDAAAVYEIAADDGFVPKQDELFAFSGIEGNFRMQHSDEMITFGSKILELCESEIRANKFPEANQI